MSGQMGEVRTERIELRVTPEEKATIEGRAARNGLRVSMYLRRRALSTDGAGAGGGPQSKDDFPPAAGPSPAKKKEPGMVSRVFGDG